MTNKLAAVFLSSFIAITGIFVIAYQYMQFFVYNMLTFFGICVTDAPYCAPVVGVTTAVFIGIISSLLSVLIVLIARKSMLSRKVRIRVEPYPDQGPSYLQMAGITIFNDEPVGIVSNLRVELQNIGLMYGEKFIGNVFPRDQHIVLNKQDGVIKPDSLPSGKSEYFVIADIVGHHVSFLFNKGARPYMISVQDGDIEATDFELRMKILGNADGDRRVERGPFKMRMVMKKPTDDHSWINILFSSDEDARVAGNVPPRKRA